MKNISHLAPILALAACATAAPQKPTAVNTGRQETREQLPVTTEPIFNDFQLDDEVDETPDPEMEKLMKQIADEIQRAQETIQRAQETMDEMKKAVDSLGLPQPPEPIPDEIIP